MMGGKTPLPNITNLWFLSGSTVPFFTQHVGGHSVSFTTVAPKQSLTLLVQYFSLTSENAIIFNYLYVSSNSSAHFRKDRKKKLFCDGKTRGFLNVFTVVIHGFFLCSLTCRTGFPKSSYRHLGATEWKWGPWRSDPPHLTVCSTMLVAGKWQDSPAAVVTFVWSLSKKIWGRRNHRQEQRWMTLWKRKFREVEMLQVWGF